MDDDIRELHLGQTKQRKYHRYGNVTHLLGPVMVPPLGIELA